MQLCCRYFVVLVTIFTSAQWPVASPLSGGEWQVEPVKTQFPVEWDRHERIALVGNSLAERMNLFGHFETHLHLRFPDQELVVRNFGWPADAVGRQQRPNDYTKLGDPLEAYGPETFFCFFGFCESFAGPEDLLYFQQRYAEYLADLTRRFGRDGREPRFMLISPIAFESTGHPLQPNGAAENANLQLYTSAIREFAQERNLPFVDLFTPTQTLFAAEPGAQYTINGIHLNEAGDLLVGRLLDAALFQGDQPTQPGSPAYERLRAAVNDKSWVHLNDYRMLNGWYVYGDRRTFDTETFPREYQKIRAMAAVRDRYVWSLAQGKPVPPVPDDSQTGELIVPPTGLGREFPRAEPAELKYPTPEEAIAMMTVSEGLEVQLFASEREFPALANPCQLNFDNRGRLWAACMPNYPQWRPGDPRPDDRLLILEDGDGDGRADQVHVFYDKLSCPTGFEFFGGGVLVVDQPRLLFLKDTDGDDRADEVVHLFDGLATDDTHHTMGAFEWSHGGLLHMLEGIAVSTTLETPWGAFRNKNTGGCYVFDPRSLRMRHFQTPGYGNPWCMVFDAWGNGIVGDGTSAKQHWASPLSGADPPTRATTRPIFDNEGMRPAVGSEFLLSRHLPDELQGQFIYACVINMNGLPRFTVQDEDEGGGLTGQRIADLLASTDKTFRPVDPQVGPDGALWFGDWSNALIGHMQYSQRDPSRDHRHGRIYRLVNTRRSLIEPETQADKSVAELLDQLQAYEQRTRYRARRELRDRDQQEVLAALDRWIEAQSADSPDYARLLCEALWIQESFRAVDVKLLSRILRSPDFPARAAAVHVMSNEASRVPETFELLRQAIHDPHPRVRLEAVRGASFFATPEAARLALEVALQPVDYWIDYTLHHTLLALRPVWLQSHVKGEFLAPVSPAGKKYFGEFLATLGPSMQAVPHLQVLVDSGTEPPQRAAAVEALTRLNGNARNGEEVFYRVCSACHRIGARGINFGPDLTQVHRRVKPNDLRANLIQAIVAPNQEVAKEYQTLQIVTTDGLVLTGFLEKEDQQSLTLRMAGGKLQTLAREEIEEHIVHRVSSMPEGLAFSIAPSEFLDLVEYLAQLNRP